jgi:hypothetical protein
MKIRTFARLFIFIVLIVFASCGDNDDVIDLNAPEIGPLAPGLEIKPSRGQVFGVNDTGLELAFSVTDPSGVLEVLVDIHGGFDGHSHARTKSDFERLNFRKILSAGQQVSGVSFQDNNRMLLVDGLRVNWDGPESSLLGNLLAGPYHVTISATDVYGNQTAFADGSNYHTTVYLRRPYAPQIDLGTNEKLLVGANQQVRLLGEIFRSSHTLATDLAFIMIRLVNADDFDETDAGVQRVEFFNVRLGKSSWRNLSGSPIRDVNRQQLDELQDLQVLRWPTQKGSYKLIFWVEDFAGNVTRQVFDIEVE